METQNLQHDKMTKKSDIIEQNTNRKQVQCFAFTVMKTIYSNMDNLRIKSRVGQKNKKFKTKFE